MFIRCAEGCINRDHVVRVSTVWSDRGRCRESTLHDAAGRVIGTKAEWNPYADNSELVAAAAGAYAVAVWPDEDSGEPYCERVPVIAWRVHQTGSPTPVLAENAGDALILLPAPDGKFIAMGDQTFDTLEEALEQIQAPHRHRAALAAVNAA